MGRWARGLVFMVLASGVGLRAARAQTCAELKAEIARLQQTLRNEQNALANCNAHLGSCTPGQISSFQQAIKIAGDEIAADQARLRTVCAPPPPPNFDHVSLQGLEVVQAVQDTANSVPLIAGKTTWVRAYLDKNTGTRTVTATLTAAGATTVNISASAPITVNPAESLVIRRSTWSKSLNFAIPAALTAAGTTAFTLSTPRDVATTPKTIICANCSTPLSVTFKNAPPLVVRAIGISYTFTPPAGGPAVTASPAATDFTLLQSWLGRAYPVSQTTFSQTTVASTTAAPFLCGSANAQLAAIRATDMAQPGADSRTHYLGLVSTQGFGMRGCSSGIPGSADPTTVASLPSGPPSASIVPVNVAGDTDGSFADWYGGHELAHTFGRAHPGFCNGNSADDAAFPYPNGQISDGTSNSFVGLDVGDSTNSISLAALWGGSTFDIMTYCNQPQWLSAYTYQAVHQRLLDENPGFVELAAHLPSRPGAGANQVHVVARLNLTKKTGSIDYVTPLPRVAPSVGPTGRAELVVRDAQKRELLRRPVPVKLDTDIPPGEDQTALVDAAIPFKPNMAQIELVLDGAVVAQYTSDQRPPVPARGLKLTVEPKTGERTLSWVAPEKAPPNVRYTVQVSQDGKQWTTVAVGLTAPALVLPRSEAAPRMARVIASTGFRSSAPATLNMAPPAPKR